MTQEHEKVQQEYYEDAQESGIEKEQFDENIEIERPYDPEKIKISRETKTIDLLLSRIGHDEIDLAPDFQRLAGIWDLGRKSRLIESLLLRIPLPVFYVAADADENWSVVDGLQRLTTIRDYAAEGTSGFKLKGLEYLLELNGRTFNELPRNMQRRIIETELVFNVIQPGTPEQVMFNIFSRINTGGLSLNGQEIRHALNKGPAREFLKLMAESDEFQAATNGSISDRRMAARECCLRFAAFLVFDWKSYEGSDLDGFLSSFMRELNSMDDHHRQSLMGEFRRSMSASHMLFGDYSFRKRYRMENSRTNPISKALFEIWSVNLARLTDSELSRLFEQKSRLNQIFVDRMNTDNDFEVSISYSTGSARRVHKRFGTVREIIEETLA